MAFPGGKYDETASNLTNTALRECYEEIGIPMDEIEVIGQLSNLYIQVTNMQVTPVVGFLNKVPTYKLDAFEVEKLFIIELADIFNPLNKVKETWNFRGNDIEVPFYNLQSQKVWGATAMMLSEFEQIANEFIG